MQKILCSFDVDATDTDSRVIEGVGVPWDEVAVLPGLGRVQFAPGSLVAARRRTPLLLGHDGEPAGVLAAIVDDEDGARVSFRVDETPDGDRALVQAASGSRGSLSVGADIAKSERLDDGTLRVLEAPFVHFALVPHGAFTGAEVVRVAAELELGDEPEPDEPDEPADLPDGDDDDQEEDEEMNAATAVEPAEVRAELAQPIRVRDRGPELPRYAGDYVRLAVKAELGDPEARRVMAALSVVAPADTPGVLPPSYTETILGEQPIIRPLAGICASRPMPATGLQIIKPVWTTQPAGGWVQPSDPTPSNKAAIGTQTVDVRQWAYGISMKWAVATRSAPDFADAVYRRALADYAEDVETLLAAAVEGKVSDNGGGQDTLGGAVAHYFGINKAGPTLLLLSPDKAGELIDAEGFLKYASGAIAASSADGFYGTIAGMSVIVSPALSMKTAIVAGRGAVELRETSPARLTAQNVGALELELGVTLETTVDVEVPTAFVGIDADWSPRSDAPAGRARRGGTA